MDKKAIIKVLLLSRYSRLGASSRVRSYQYLPYLKTQGIDVTVAPLLRDGYINDLYMGKRKHFGTIFGAYLRRFGYLLKSGRFDLLWLEKELMPWLPAWGEAGLSHLGIPYVVDYDDATFHRYDRHPKGMVRALLGGKIDAVMRRAALVTVGNDYLADRAWRVGAKRVEYLPTVVDLKRYCVTSQPKDEVFTIGWIGTPNTEKYLSLIADPLRRFFEQRKGRLLLIGASKRFMIDGIPIEVLPWSEDCEVPFLQRMHIGIMPLPDLPMERGKSGLKLLQYFACGRPSVASPVGINVKIVNHRVGFLPNSDDEWLTHLLRLADDPDLRKRTGEEGRRMVEERYSLARWALKYAHILREVAQQYKNGTL